MLQWVKVSYNRLQWVTVGYNTLGYNGLRLLQ